MPTAAKAVFAPLSHSPFQNMTSDIVAIVAARILSGKFFKALKKEFPARNAPANNALTAAIAIPTTIATNAKPAITKMDESTHSFPVILMFMLPPVIYCIQIWRTTKNEWGVDSFTRAVIQNLKKW